MFNIPAIKQCFFVTCCCFIRSLDSRFSLMWDGSTTSWAVQLDNTWVCHNRRLIVSAYIIWWKVFSNLISTLLNLLSAVLQAICKRNMFRIRIRYHEYRTWSMVIVVPNVCFNSECINASFVKNTYNLECFSFICLLI